MTELDAAILEFSSCLEEANAQVELGCNVDVLVRGESCDVCGDGVGVMGCVCIV